MPSERRSAAPTSALRRLKRRDQLPYVCFMREPSKGLRHGNVSEEHERLWVRRLTTKTSASLARALGTAIMDYYREVC